MAQRSWAESKSVAGRARLAGAEVEGFNVFAAGELADASEDLGAVMEEFVADDGVAGEDGEAVALDHRGVRERGVGGADDLRPVIANRLLRGGAADLMLLQELFENDRKVLGGPFDGAARFFGFEAAAQIADEFFGEFAEFGRWGVVGHAEMKPKPPPAKYAKGR